MKEENKKYRVAAKEAIKEIKSLNWDELTINEQEALNDLEDGGNWKYNINLLAPKTIAKYIDILSPTDRLEEAIIYSLFYTYVGVKVMNY